MELDSFAKPVLQSALRWSCPSDDEAAEVRQSQTWGERARVPEKLCRSWCYKGPMIVPLDSGGRHVGMEEVFSGMWYVSGEISFAGSSRSLKQSRHFLAPQLSALPGNRSLLATELIPKWLEE